MPAHRYNTICSCCLVVGLITLIPSSLLSNLFPTDIIIFGPCNVAIAQTQPSTTSEFQLRNIEDSISLDRGGDPLQVSNYTNITDRNCEVCSFINYIPGPLGKAGVAYRSSQTLDLTGAQRIVLFAKGEFGGEKLAFVALGKHSNTISTQQNLFPNLSFKVITKNVTLTPTWTKYELNLTDSGTTGITDPFGFILYNSNSYLVICVLELVVLDFRFVVIM